MRSCTTIAFQPFFRLATAALLLNGALLVLLLTVGVSTAQDTDDVLLQEVEGSPVLADLQSELMALSPDGRFVFVANDTTVTAYEVTAAGLEEVSGSPFYVAGNDYQPAALVVHPNGRFLYVAHAGFVGRSLQAPVAAYSIQQETGALVELRGSPFSTYAASGRGLSALAITPNGRYLYAVNTDNKTVTLFTVNTRTGALRERDIVAVGGLTYAPVDAVVRPDGRYLYLVNQGFTEDENVEDASPLSIYRIDSRSGGLRETYSSPVSIPTDGGKGLSGVAVHPNGDFLFALNETNKAVTLLRLDTLGTPAEQFTFRIDGDDFSPHDISVSPDGGLLFISNTGFVPMSLLSPITVLMFDAEELAITATWQVPVLAQGDGLGQLAISPDAGYLYVSNPGLGGVHMFAISEALQDRARARLRISPSSAWPQESGDDVRVFGMAAQ